MNDLNKALGLPLLIFYGTGMILGAGIYSIIGAAASEAQVALWMSFLLSSIMALLTGLSYAEMATMYPKSGAEYIYLKEAFPERPFLATCVGCLVATGLATSATTVSVAFAGYLEHFIQAPPLLVALLLMALFSFVNVLGIEESSWANVVFTLIEASGLVLFIAMGIYATDLGVPLKALPHAGVLSGASLLSFSFFGFENIANLAEEAKDPSKNIPKAIWWSIGIATLLYVLVSLSAVSLLPHEVLSKSSRPLAQAAEAHFPGLSGVLSGIALFSTANTVLIALLITSRIFYGMAKGGDLPAVFAKVHRKRKTPWVASLMGFLFAAIFLPVKQVEALANISSFATLVSFIAVSLALIRLRKTKPNIERPYRVPGDFKGIPVIPLLAIVATFFLLLQFDRNTYLVGVSVLVLFIVVSLIWKKGRTFYAVSED